MSNKGDDRNEQLKPGYCVTKLTTVQGQRTHKISSVLKKEGKPGDEYTVLIPKLGENSVIIPDTMNLTFQLKNSNTKSWFVQNIGQQLQKELKITYNDVYIYENKVESTYGTYTDMWKCEEEREQMRDLGIASEGIRKVWCGDNSAPTTVDVTTTYSP